MGDGKALQMGTSHELGQNFAKAFDITYTRRPGAAELLDHVLGHLDPDGRRPDHVHGDDNGLRVPPRLAPIQVAVMVVKAATAAAAAPRRATRSRAGGVRVDFDDRVDTPFGRRAVDGELKGYRYASRSARATWPNGVATVARRVIGGKTPVRAGRRGRRRPAAPVERPAALLRRRAAARDARIARCQDARRGGRGRGDRLGPAALVGGRHGGRGEAGRAAVTVRCLVRADGTVPDSETRSRPDRRPGPVLLNQGRTLVVSNLPRAEPGTR